MTKNHESEILEVVDAQDRVIGHATRGEIHRRGLLHRSAHIFVFNEAGEVFVQRRSSNKDKFPGKLDSSAAGHVDPGESYMQAAERELREELGIEAELEEALRSSDFRITDNEHVWLFTGVTDSEPIPDPDEIQWGEFMSGQRLSDLMEENPDDFVPAFIHLWKWFRREEP
jgi:isopentenyl-diphosphate delta-isomerase type 1